MARIFQFLIEANVANPDSITRYAEVFSTHARPKEAKEWFLKKVRAFVVNSPEYLIPVRDTSGLPPWAEQAMERGETVYMFDQNNPALGQLSETLEHISDWFAAMADTIKRPANNPVEIEDRALTAKELGSIMKLSVPQAHERADKWFAHMGSRSKVDTKALEGVKVVKEWPDGYYAVTFTTEAAMMKDGKELQNCLAQAYYWSAVARGTNQVYAIRKPNNEAVVGIRVDMQNTRPGWQPAFTDPAERKRAPGLAECKGKNNKPVSPQYQQYAIDLIQALGIDATNNIDLKNAGIYSRGGKLGTFKDIADIVYDEGGLKIWKSDDKFLAERDRGAISGVITGGEISSVEWSDDLHFTCSVLNALGLPPNKSLVRVAYAQGVFFRDGHYGSIDEVGEVLGSDGDVRYIGVQGRVYLMSKGKRVGVLDIETETGKLHNAEIRVPRGLIAGANDTGVLITALNTLKLAPDAAFELHWSKAGVYYNGKRWGTIEEVGTKIAPVMSRDVGRSPTHLGTLYRLGKRSVWIADDEGTAAGTPVRLTITNKKIAIRDIDLVDQALARGAAEVVSKKYGAISVVDADKLDILNNLIGPMFSKDDVLKNLDALTTEWRNDGWMPWRLDLRVESFFREIGYTMTDEEKLRVLKAMRPTAKMPVKIEVADTAKVFDLEFQELRVYLPLSAYQALHALNDEATTEIPAFIKQDVTNAIASAAKRIEATPYGKVTLASYHRGFDFTALDDAMDAITRRTNEAVRERTANPDKHATDLSSRFAAMNAKRKLGL